ncbi:MAG: cation transporter [Pseudomonadota bacterium]
MNQAEGPVPPVALARERSILVACLCDIALIAPFLSVGIWANSLMMLAECARGTLLVVLELLLLVLMRRIHRGRIHDYDYGSGKIEQFANAGIGTAMGLAGVWVGLGALWRWFHPPSQDQFSLLVVAALGGINLVLNAYLLWKLWQAGRDGASIILTGQVRTRLVKTLSSGIVMAAFCVNAVFVDGVVGQVAELVGGLFIAAAMVQLSVSMWQQALPSLLDRTLEEAQQRLINKALVAHFDAYDRLISVRSRLSGNTPHVQIELGFLAARSLGDVQAVADRVQREVASLIPGAAVAIIPRATD